MSMSISMTEHMSFHMSKGLDIAVLYISVVLIGQGTPMSGVKGFMIGCTRGVVCIQCYWLHLPRAETMATCQQQRGDLLNDFDCSF